MARNAKTRTVLDSTAALAAAGGTAPAVENAEVTDQATENGGGTAADGSIVASDAGQTTQAQAVVFDTAQTLTNTGADVSQAGGTSLPAVFGSQDSGQADAAANLFVAVEPAAEANSTNTPESEAENGGAGDTASPAAGTFDLQARADALALAEAKYPKLCALFHAARASGLKPTGIRISSRWEGFMRGGVRHPVAATDYALDRLTAEQLEAMLNEPALTVALI